MNLKLSLPKGVDEQSVVFSLPFDIDRKAKRTDGHLTATKEKLSVYYNGELCEQFLLEDLMEIEVEQLIGCSMLCVKDAFGKQKFVCAFSQKHFMRFAELAKIIDHYLKTGVFTETTDADEPACPRCGISLNGSKKCVYCEGDKGVFVKLIKRLKPYRKQFIFSLFSTRNIG